MNKIKSIIIAVLVLVIGSFNLNAQSLDGLRQKAEEAYKKVSVEKCLVFSQTYEYAQVNITIYYIF